MITSTIGRLATYLTQLACCHGTHVYLSTGCLHDQHGYCQSHTGQSGAKTPAQCKFCQAPCTCPCHKETPGA